VPSWIEHLRRGAATIRPEQLSPLVPPPGTSLRRGAVLLLFGQGPAGPDLLLTERAHDMRSHPGQVSFPGGSIDPGESPEAAALRETHEETGVDPTGVTVLGTLPELWLPPSNFAVTPVLAWWREESPMAVVDPREVHAIYRVPLDELLAPDHRVSVRHPSGWVGPGFLIGRDREVILWGFTAGVISRLLDHVGLTRPWDAERMHDLPERMLRPRT
jgi:8-oxo-dGTP pyrophosphatase MutT (NUDIX family)